MLSTSASTGDLLAAADEWVAQDPNPETRGIVSDAADALRNGTGADNSEEAAALKNMLGGRLVFGTAGIRGTMGAGTLAMNDLVIMQTAAGLADYLLDTVGDDVKRMGVAVGFDARAHSSLSSKKFAQLTADALTSRGIACVCL